MYSVIISDSIGLNPTCLLPAEAGSGGWGVCKAQFGDTFTITSSRLSAKVVDNGKFFKCNVGYSIVHMLAEEGKVTGGAGMLVDAIEHI